VKPEVLALEGRESCEEAIERAARLVDDGGLVAFPTDTVYGLGVAADRSDAIDRLYRVKGRAGSKPLARLVPDDAAARAASPSWPRLAAKLGRIHWPGALTIVAGGIGWRVPADQNARALSGRVRGQLAATSANRSGSPDARTAAEVVEALGSDVDLVLDGGRTPGVPSTVVRVDGPRLEVLREGEITRADLELEALPTVLFVCRGNTCRSPIAAALMEAQLGIRGRSDVVVLSAGTDVGGEASGRSATGLAAEVVREAGGDLSGHAARPVTPALLGRADWVFVMERSQLERILELLPEERPRVRVLDLSGHDIFDPFGEDIEVYRNARDRIADAVGARVLEIVESLDSDEEHTP
jgi:L-threonylcarbamoyladenylate synthase